MIIIRNNIIPFPGFKAMNICGILFIRKNAVLSDITLNHEEIHSKQWFELLIIGFLLWYCAEWLIRILFSKDKFTHNAYKNISLEQEAYQNQENLEYLNNRKHYNFVKYLK